MAKASLALNALLTLCIYYISIDSERDGRTFLRDVLATKGKGVPFRYANFTELAKSTFPVTDKVTAHAFGSIYDVYFDTAARNRNVKLLEIGLGCGVRYGAGASSKIWPVLFPKGDIWFAEYDKACIEKFWTNDLPWKYVVGDQANLGDLRSWVETMRGGFDYIIHDGAHTNPSIWQSFEYLFEKALKPGGAYSRT